MAAETSIKPTKVPNRAVLEVDLQRVENEYLIAKEQLIKARVSGFESDQAKYLTLCNTLSDQMDDLKRELKSISLE